MRVALATAALRGDNAGDAWIEEALRRFMVADEFVRVPLVAPLSERHLDAINGSAALVLCGTNLYQAVFACNLTRATLRRIRIPIVPVGVGTSAPLGRHPDMDRESRARVREVHERCVRGGVRDPASLEFVEGLGVRNAVLTGCPVLFHALRPPVFDGAGRGLALSVRARLLHIEAGWLARQEQALERACAAARPTLVAQSPYDLPLAQALAARHGLDVSYDPEWQGEAYVPLAAGCAMAAGFRLHFGMLALSYGRPACFVAHDSRVAEFCRMMGLPALDIRTFTDEEWLEGLTAVSFDGSDFARRWHALARDMRRVLEANGLACRLPETAAAPEDEAVRRG